MDAPDNDAGNHAFRERRSGDGLTLVEIIVAMGVLALVFSAFLTSFTISRRTTAMTYNLLAGTHQARQQMEQLVACRFYDSALTVGTHTVPNGNYVVSLDPSNSSIKAVTLTVSWAEPLSAITSSVSMTTAIGTTLHQ